MEESLKLEIENINTELNKAILLIENVQKNFDYNLDIEKCSDNLYFKYKRYQRFLLKAQEILNNNVNVFENLANYITAIEDKYIDDLINGELSVYDEED